ncbi:hypothetical protein [Bradyrhizobium sp. RDI18]|uniref:hypothetical protein n=1 Tax=Bradyrhizobium sp. RDI18 TaxID=3367400 RepID=UPI00371B369F
MEDRIGPDRSVFNDVIWTRIDMAPLQSCAPRDHRLFAKVPHGRWHHDLLTFLAALHHNWTIARCLDRFTRANAPTTSNPVDYEPPCDRELLELRNRTTFVAIAR